MLFEKAVQYAQDVISGKEIANRYVKIQCEWFLADLAKADSPDFPYYFDFKQIAKVEGIFKLLNFATGIGVVGSNVLEGLVGFQAFFFVNIFGWRFKTDSAKFRFRDVTLFICRKNGKTWITALLVIVLMLTEDKFSEFYSISKDRELASEVKKAINQILNASPAILKYFTIPKTLSGKVLCKITQSFYQPRTADPDANNGLRPSCVLADECGAFKDLRNIGAMKSGQLSVRNPLLIKLTTAYAESLSIMHDEIAYIKKVFNRLIPDDRMFALLYYAEPEHLWDDTGMFQANPLRVEANYDEIRATRTKAIEKANEREEYLTKHCNHWLETNSGESYVELEDLRKCKIAEFDWRSRPVWVGVDLAMTTDNCAVSIVTEEDRVIYADSFAFVPSERIPEKNRTEKIDYYEFIQQGKCFASGEQVVDYGQIEEFVMGLEERLGVTVMGISFDRYNCLSSAQRWEREGLRVAECKQHSSVLHPATKLLREAILKQEFHYTNNPLLEMNFANCKIVENNNKDFYINKKKSTGKIDMVAALVNGIWLLQQDVIFNPDYDWSIQVI